MTKTVEIIIQKANGEKSWLQIPVNEGVRIVITENSGDHLISVIDVSTEKYVAHGQVDSIK